MTRFTEIELAADESMSSDDYEGDEAGSGNYGYHWDVSGNEAIIERTVFRKFIARPHAHENGYQ